MSTVPSHQKKLLSGFIEFKKKDEPNRQNFGMVGSKFYKTQYSLNFMKKP